MIDVNNIQIGDCLMNFRNDRNTLCYVLFPFVKYGVCIRHEYEWTENYIRIMHYQPMAPSNIKDYKYIPVVDLKRIILVFKTVTQQAVDIVMKAPKSSVPDPDKEPFLLYQTVTGDYVIAPQNFDNDENNCTLTVSSAELACYKTPPQDWQTGGAEKNYIDPHIYHVLKDLFDANIAILTREYDKVVNKERE